MTTRLHTVGGLLGFFVVVTAIAVAAPAATAQDQAPTYDLGSDHSLAADGVGEAYGDDGIVTATPAGLDLRISVASSHDDVGVEGWTHTDFDRHYLRVQYNESIERTLQFDVPASVFTPHPYDDLESVGGNVTADLSTVRNGSATQVTVTADGQTDAVFPISRAAGLVFGIRDTTSSYIENVTGWDLPSIGGDSDAWTRIDESAWSGNGTPAIETGGEHLMLHYDASSEPGDHAWVAVPSCSAARSYEPVCRFSQEGSEQVMVVSQTNETPAVRYRHGRDLISEARAALNELIELPGDLLDEILGGSTGWL